jgi:hypothetical protein
VATGPAYRMALLGLSLLVALLPPAVGRTAGVTAGKLLVVNFWSPPRQNAVRAQLASVQGNQVSVLAQNRQSPYTAMAPSPDAKHIRSSTGMHSGS